MDLLHAQQPTSVNTPTAAEKAALDASTAPDADNPFVTHGAAGDLTDSQLTALAGAAVGNIPSTDQKGALGASTGANASNPFVTHGAAGDITANQLAGIVANPALSGANRVASKNDLLAMAEGAPPTASTIYWSSGVIGISALTHKAILLRCPATGASQTYRSTAITGSGQITFMGTFSSSDKCIAWLFPADAIGGFT